MEWHDQTQEETERIGAAIDEVSRNRGTSWRNLLLFVVVIAAFLLMKNALGPETIRLDTTGIKTQMGVVGLDGVTHTFVYADMESIELREDLRTFDKGEALSGSETRRVCSGTYRNAEYGEYELHVNTKLHCFLVVRTPDGVLAFNYESDDTTKGIYNSILSQLSGQQ